MGIKENANKYEIVDFEKHDNLLMGNWTSEIAEKYFAAESEWIDKEFRKNWSPIFSNFTEMMNRKLRRGLQPNLFERILVFIFAKASRLTIERNKHLNMPGAGFRPGTTLLDSVTVRLLKGKKEVAKKDFKLSIILK